MSHADIEFDRRVSPDDRGSGMNEDCSPTCLADVSLLFSLSCGGRLRES
jgi:hypothetical protein